MAQIEIKNLAHSYMVNPTSVSDYAISRLDLTWVDGGAYSLLGPSGCGKSTLLNIISGLLNPTEGSVLFNGDDVTKNTTQQRNIAQVFQFPVIYDTMSVFDNLAFPLRNRKYPEDKTRKRVEEVAELLDLSGDLKKKARGLTADVKQMISLGRGLVRNDVSAILFDEPMTVIDPHVKWIVRRRLKQIQEQFNVTMVLVTHDQTEALTFADQVLVMYEGKVVQQGTPEELFVNPSHTFVGYFIGSPGMNLFPCHIEDNQAVVNNTAIPLPNNLIEKASRTEGKLKLGIRPEFCEIVEKGAENSFPLEIRRVENLGDHLLVRGRFGEQRLWVKLSAEKKLEAGKLGWFSFPEEHIRLYADEYLI